MSSHDDETPHLPPPSLWPVGFAIGIACLLVGLVVSSARRRIGAVIAAVFGFLWVRDVTRAVRAPRGGRADAGAPPRQPATSAPSSASPRRR